MFHVLPHSDLLVPYESWGQYFQRAEYSAALPPVERDSFSPVHLPHTRGF